MKLLICPISKESHKNDTLVVHSLNDIIRHAEIDKHEVDYFFTLNNQTALPVVYNKLIAKADKEKYDWLVICHDDIYINTVDLANYLDRRYFDFDVIGVAGASEIKLQSLALWHLMGGGFGSKNLHGAVTHIYSNDLNPHSHLHSKKHITAFGIYPHRVVVLDGVFLAMRVDKVKDIKADETNPSKYHFYDLDFVLTCHKNRLKIGVGDIMITHQSHGLKEFTQEWKEGERWFLNKWKTK